MTDWDQYNHNDGYGELYRDSPTSTGSPESSDYGSTSNSARSSMKKAVTARRNPRKDSKLEKRVQTFFWTVLLIFGFLAVILFFSAGIASMLHAHGVQVYCVKGLGLSIVVCIISALIAID